MQAWRIGHRAFPLMDGGGAAAYPGRWNGPRQPAIYCGGSFAIAMLERLCYARLGRVPKTDVHVEIVVSDAMIERFDPAAHSGWERQRSAVAKTFGVRWLAAVRSVALLVPSAGTRLGWNPVINPGQPDFSRLTGLEPKAGA